METSVARMYILHKYQEGTSSESLPRAIRTDSEDCLSFHLIFLI